MLGLIEHCAYLCLHPACVGWTRQHPRPFGPRVTVQIRQISSTASSLAAGRCELAIQMSCGDLTPGWSSISIYCLWAIQVKAKECSEKQNSTSVYTGLEVCLKDLDVVSLSSPWLGGREFDSPLLPKRTASLCNLGQRLIQGNLETELTACNYYYYHCPHFEKAWIYI